jgi:hypothetical protein
MFSSRNAHRRGPLERLGKVVVIEDVLALQKQIIEGAETNNLADILDALKELCKHYISLELLESTRIGHTVKKLARKKIVKRMIDSGHQKRHVQDTANIESARLARSKQKALGTEIVHIASTLIGKWRAIAMPAFERRTRLSDQTSARSEKRYSSTRMVGPNKRHSSVRKIFVRQSRHSSTMPSKVVVNAPRRKPLPIISVKPTGTGDAEFLEQKCGERLDMASVKHLKRPKRAALGSNGSTTNKRHRQNRRRRGNDP